MWVAPWGVVQDLHPFAKSTALCKRGEHLADHHGSPLPGRALNPLRRASRARATPKHTAWVERSPLQRLAREKCKQKPGHDGNQSRVGALGLPAEPCLLRPAPRGAAAPARPVPAVAAPREAARALQQQPWRGAASPCAAVLPNLLLPALKYQGNYSSGSQGPEQCRWRLATGAPRGP